jgi:hypothetical protein
MTLLDERLLAADVEPTRSTGSVARTDLPIARTSGTCTRDPNARPE